MSQTIEFKRPPVNLTVGLKYTYMPEEFEYDFPRLRKVDAEVNDRERMLGNGRKYTPAERLSQIVLDIRGWEPYGFNSKGKSESLNVFRSRVALFFGDEQFQEYAEDALIYRINTVYPASTFPGTGTSSVEVNIPGAEAGGGTVLRLSDVPQAGTRSGDGLSGLPVDTGPGATQEDNSSRGD